MGKPIHKHNAVPRGGTNEIREAQRRGVVPFDLGHVRKAPGFEVPDIEGTVEGWRAWTVAKRLPPFGVAPKLHSVTHGGYTWYPQQTAEAECVADHVPAAAKCGCGFYSAKTLQRLMELGYHSYADYDNDTFVKVVGRVANWGQVTEASWGWRSQFSYPVMLFVPYEAHRLAKPLMEAFGCKVRLLDFQKNPGDLDQVAIAQGKYEPVEVLNRERAKVQGRKCHHKQLPLHGYLGGEPFDKDGELWVNVRWDVRPDNPVPMKLATLRLDRKAA